jgi:TM2 domain-containing membrane protein YozV/ribosomal protein L37E
VQAPGLRPVPGRIDLTLEGLDIRCARCGRTIDDGARHCTNCGCPVGRSIGGAPAQAASSYQQYRRAPAQKSPATACLLNLLLLGAGYFYLGQIGKGIGVFLLSVLAGLATSGVGTIIGLIYAMVDCYNTGLYPVLRVLC